MGKLVVYLANKYSSSNKDPDAASLERHNRRILESYVGGKLRKKYGVALILPIALSASMSDLCDFGSGFSEWAGDDYEFIDRSDEVWVMKSHAWETSVGVKAEIKHAKATNKPVKFINIETLEFEDE